jgi:hypothetical protein
MGQPTPPGDSPLIEGLDASWNELVQYIPEDKRAEFAPKFRDRIKTEYEPLKQWEDLHKSGITPDQAGTALNVFTMIENDPRKVYQAIGDHLGISAQDVKQVAEEIEAGDDDDPRIVAMQEQLDTLAQIALAQRNQSAQEKEIAQQEAAIDKEIAEAIAQYGEVPEDELVMRMLHKGMTAAEAHQEYTGRANEIRSRRPAPMIMGAGGSIPSKAIDPRKLDSVGTKNLVAQMLEHAKGER